MLNFLNPEHPNHHPVQGSTGSTGRKQFSNVYQSVVAKKLFDEFGELYSNNKHHPAFIALVESGEYVRLDNG